MNKEIIYTDKLLWAALFGLLVGAYALGAGATWLWAAGAAIGAGVLTVVAVTLVLGPVADYLVLRNLEGKSRSQAVVISIVGMLLGAIYVGAIYGLSGVLKDVKNVWLDYLGYGFIVFALVFNIRRSVHARRERAKLKVVDLSRSRDMQLK
ncbi:hypothetical protein [Rhodoferax fermentans]|uniref:Uncharacterized protein n=1 Tax=Rhodoferax fermentans TaxID=28066 RepID=A0A1T1AP92_RHOFE|nr:hypothetical protein [Rhodoferax fermentans]OOV05748.1 hypothetical protein RF819_02645 [Rhodoferax fermentans]